jgi:outer membrane protein assembly factor BamB
VSYNKFRVLVDPANGAPVQLRDSEGQIRTDSEGAARRWEISGDASSSQFFTTPVWWDDDTLLVLNYEGSLILVSYPNACLANRSGACVDNFTEAELPGRALADMVADSGRVFVALADHDLVAVDLESLEQEWLFETDRGLWADPVVVDGIVYFGSMNHHFYAVNAASGEQIWERDLDGALASAPLYYDGGDGEDGYARFFVGSFGRKLYEVSMTGEILSEYRAENWIWSTPVLRDDTLYITDMSGFVHALDIKNGLREVWKTDTGSEGIRPSPLVTDEFVIVASRDGIVFWLDRETGVEQFHQDVGAEILSELLLVERPDETLVVISTVKKEKTLVAFTLDGAPRWTYNRG